MLKKSKVVFNEKDHTYFLGNKQLQGITGILSRQLFPNKYSGIAIEVMEAAAKKGSLIHEEVETFIKTGKYGFTDEFYEWFENCFNTDSEYESEFLIDNGKNFATAIDIVEDVNHTDKTVILKDIKTTYSLDKEYLSWQLSINAVMFEKQTGYKVIGLFAIWLRGNASKEVEITRKSDKEIKELFKAEITGTQYTPTSLILTDKEIDSINALETMLTAIKGQEKALKDTIKAKMKEQHIKKATIGNLTFSYIEPTTRQSLDRKLLEKEQPNIYTQYLRTSNVSDSVRIKVNENGED